MSKEEEFRLKLQKLELLEQQIKLKDGLPHLYGLKRYPWQQKYWETTNKKAMICAANQIGKSTIQICKRIHIATEKDLWGKLWPSIMKVNPNTKPVSWYLYPNQDTTKSEIETKWIPYYLPQGEFRDHEVYGWHIVKENKVIKYIEFNTGYRIYFKTYNQNVQDLQSGTIFAVDADEELPINLLSELQARLFATDGYFSMAFTATLGQDHWYRVIERKNEFDEIWPEAFKIQISMYDCLKYVDGSETPWTAHRIETVKQNCKSDNEVQRRVYGRFVKDEGLKYPAFSRDRNLKAFPKDNNGKLFKGVPHGWTVYTAVDIGGGGTGHPAAYSFLSVSPDYTKIRWFKGRRLDGIETTAADIYEHYKISRGKLDPVAQVYDFAGKDFGTIVTRAGEPFNKAQKDHELGEMVLNTVLKTGMFVIYHDPEDPDDEAMKLVREFETLRVDTNKRNAVDDFIDTCRYGMVEIPIDWEAVLNGHEGKKKEKKKITGRRGEDYGRFWENEEDEEADKDFIDNEIDEWAELY
jgi:hypothetical protein